MKYQVGDKIMVLATKEQGEIIEWINKEMLLIDVDGIRFPVYADQIDFPYYSAFTEKKKENFNTKKNIDSIPTEKKVHIQKTVDGVWLSFFPVLDKDIFDDDVISHFKIYLLNNTLDELNFDLSIFYGSKKEMDLKKSIKSFEELYMFDLPFENLNDQPSFQFDFSLQNIDNKKVNHFEVEYKPKPKQTFKKAEELLKEQKASFKALLFDTIPDKPAHEKFDLSKLSSAGFKLYPEGKNRANFTAARTLIDLHIEKLIDRYSHLDAVGIIGIQLNAFEKFYDEALMNNLHTITVIHGVGTGKLKDEIHEVLRLKKEVKSFINRYHVSFGYGATEIFLKTK
jgi:hypothetical protein